MTKHSPKQGVQTTPNTMCTPANPVSLNIYDRKTVRMPAQTDTPRSSKRSRTDLGDSDVATIDSLLEKVDQISVVVSKNEANINHMMNDNVHLRGELQNIKSLIISLINSTKSKPVSAPATPLSYSSVLKDVVVIAPVDPKQHFDVTRSAVTKTMNPVDSGICGVKKGANGKMLLECKNKADSEKVKSAAIAVLGSDYIVKLPEKRNPKVRIFGLRDDLQEAEFLSALMTQNNQLFTTISKIKVIKSFSVKNPILRYGFKIEVDPTTFSALIGAKSVHIGWDKCWIHEEFNLIRCFNCWGFHHTRNTCKNKLMCPNCADEHELRDCKSDIKKCCVCTVTASTSGLPLDLSHSAKSEECPCLQRKIALEKRSINYSP